VFQFISDSNVGATIYYTTDGTVPTTSSAVYLQPFTIRNTTVVKAFAVAPNYLASNVVTAKYAFGEVPTDGAVGLWRFNDLPASQTKDCSGFENEGQTNNIQADTDAVSKPTAAQFTG
jgi:hypothetical protein